MSKQFLSLAILLIVAGLSQPSVAAAQSDDEPIVRAVFFFSPSCPHCHDVINELLVPMMEEYSDQLQIAGLDTSQADGSQIYQAALQRYQVPDDRRGVPTMVVNDVVLVGGLEIPDQFPGIVEQGLASGGLDWPDIPGLAELVAQAEQQPTPTTQATAGPDVTPTATVQATAGPDVMPTATVKLTSTPPVLNIDPDLVLAKGSESSLDAIDKALTGTVLVGMIVALGFAAWRVGRARRQLLQLFQETRSLGSATKTWIIPLLVLVGLVVASYLAYVEVNQVKAVCGPVGDCNAVQSSAYTELLSIPIAVWGVLNYLAVGAFWAGQKYLKGRWTNLSALALLGLTLFGVLFSIYLTCLEMFVIHALCAWCLTSAIITTILMLLTLQLTNTSPQQGAARKQKASRA